MIYILFKKLLTNINQINKEITKFDKLIID